MQGKIIDIAAGGYHSMLLNFDLELYVSGGNDEGQCDFPKEIQGQIIGISAGAYHSLALTKN